MNSNLFKVILVLLFSSLFINSCKKDEDAKEEIKTYPIGNFDVNWINGLVGEGDTLYLPISCYSPFYINSEQENLSIEWSLEDSLINGPVFYRKFDENGLYEIKATISSTTDTSEFTFYVMVFGTVVGEFNNVEKGIIICERENHERNIITHKTAANTSSLVGYKYFENELSSANNINVEIDYGYLADKYIDNEGNILMMDNSRFIKINTINQLAFNEYMSDGCSIWADIIQTNELTYLTVKYANNGTYVLSRYQNNGDLIDKEIINNYGSQTDCKDIVFWNEDEYIMLLQDENSSQYYLKRVLISDPNQSETLMLEGEVHKLCRTDNGLFVYYLIESNESNLIYINDNFEIAFNSMFDINFHGNCIKGIREYLNTLTIATNTELLTFDKSGNLNRKYRFIEYNNDFLIQSIGKAGNNALILANVQTADQDNNNCNYNIMFIVDEAGNIIE